MQNIKNPKIVDGMTLIEILVVIAIIGLLSAIAIPSYQRYVIKTKIAEMSVYFKECEIAASKYFLDNNSFPDPIACWGGIADGASNPPTGYGSGTYQIGTTSSGYPKMLLSISRPDVPAKDGSASGLLWFGMAYDNTTGSIITSCGTSNAADTDIDPANLPKSCQDEVTNTIWGL